jgi:hypothetical protein
MMTTSWKPLTSQADCDKLMKLFGGFHDGCIREAHVWTETSVDNALGMGCPALLDTRARLLVQRQWKAPSAIELLFEEIVTFHFQPSAENCDSIILSAEMLCRADTFYWADLGGGLLSRLRAMKPHGSRQRKFHGKTPASGWVPIYVMDLATLRSNQAMQ